MATSKYEAGIEERLPDDGIRDGGFRERYVFTMVLSTSYTRWLRGINEG